MPTNIATDQRIYWVLCGPMDDDQPVRHFRVPAARFIVGRQPEASLCIPSPTVSREHAELTVIDDGLLLRDLGSTNGTYVNSARVHQPCTVHHGDLLQFGQMVFRVVQQSSDRESATTEEDSCDRALALIQFEQLLTQRDVTPHYQPIVAVADGRVLGYEVLGRSRLHGLKDPQSMFAAAKVLNLEGELSRVLREEGVCGGRVLPAEHALFVNTHAVELEDIDLLAFSLRELRGLEPTRPLVLEVKEAAVTDEKAMSQLRWALSRLNVGLAYDNYAAEPERLAELAKVPPDYLKFDLKLPAIGSTPGQERLATLTGLVARIRELGITPLAEGIESSADDATCREVGFEYAQGFYYGRPVPSKMLVEAERIPNDETVISDGDGEPQVD